MARPNNPDFQAQKLLSSVSLDLLGKKAKEHIFIRLTVLGYKDVW